MGKRGESSPCSACAVDEPGKGAGMSLYAGLRVTLTDAGNGSRPVLTVSVKARASGWDDWTNIRPASRPEHLGPISSTPDALRALAIELIAMADAEEPD